MIYGIIIFPIKSCIWIRYQYQLKLIKTESFHSRKYVISFSKWKYIYQRRRKYFSFHYTISCAADWVFNGCLFFAFSLHQLLQKILPLAFLGNNLYIVWWWLMLQGWCVSLERDLSSCYDIVSLCVYIPGFYICTAHVYQLQRWFLFL